MKNNKVATLSVIVPLVVSFTFPLFGDKFVDRVEESTSVYKALMKAKDGGVPASLLEKCQCVVVIPHVIKAAFGFGGRHGPPRARTGGHQHDAGFTGGTRIAICHVSRALFVAHQDKLYR